jgi:hypothetical protein
MTEYTEPKTIGLTKSTQEKLRRLMEDEHIKEMQDGYKFAVGLALFNNAIEPNMGTSATMYGTGDLDQGQDIYETVKALRVDCDEPIYKTVERLAEWGVKEMYEQAQNGDLDFSKLLISAEKAAAR